MHRATLRKVREQTLFSALTHVTWLSLFRCDINYIPWHSSISIY